MIGWRMDVRRPFSESIEIIFVLGNHYHQVTTKLPFNAPTGEPTRCDTKMRWYHGEKMRWYHVLRGEVHTKYLRQIVG
jgi:hypothetical protein